MNPSKKGVVHVEPEEYYWTDDQPSLCSAVIGVEVIDFRPELK